MGQAGRLRTGGREIDAVEPGPGGLLRARRYRVAGRVFSRRAVVSAVSNPNAPEPPEAGFAYETGAVGGPMV